MCASYMFARNNMNINTESTPLLGSYRPTSSSSVGSSGRTFFFRTVKSDALRSDLQAFKAVARGWFPNRNIMTSPLLINSSTDLIGKITQKTQASDASGGKIKKVSLPGSDDLSYGIHVVSNRNHVDEVLQELGARHTSIDKVHEDAQSILKLNNRIGKGTGRTVNDLFSSRLLENDPDHSFHMASWLSLEVPWRQPLEAVSSQDYPDWDGKRPPNISWLKSAPASCLVSRADIDGFDFIGVCVSKAGHKAVFVMPPIRSVTSDEMEDVFIRGLGKMMSNKKMKTAQLLLPKFHIDLLYYKEYPEAAASVAHQAVVTVDEKGSTEAAVKSKKKSQGLESVITINRPFYFAMIDHRKSHKPRIVGMAYVNNPPGCILNR